MRELLMKFENKSSKLFSITKSKAKMYEFGLDEEHHIHLAESPTKLLLMTIGIIGDLCREELSSKKDITLYEQRKGELRNVARYFDALIESKLQTKHDYYLSLLGTTSYYLADMPGSSSVLSKKLEQSRVLLTKSGVEFVLEYVINFHERPKIVIVDSDDVKFHLLNPEHLPFPDLPIFMQLFESLNRFFYPKAQVEFNEEEEKRHFSWIVDTILKYFFENGSDRELLLSQILAAVIKKRLNSSTKMLLPRYSGLDWSHWSSVSLKPTFIKEFWPAQKLLGDAGVFSGKSAVVQLPTSAGKTKSAELIIRSSFLSGRASVAVIVAPYRSLCREISTSLSAAFTNEDILVNQLNDVPQIDNFDVELLLQLFGQTDTNTTDFPTIIVATPEKLVYLLRHKPELSEVISLVIYDEGHQFDTGSRGVTYELLLTSLKLDLRVGTQHVLISAVLSNAESIGDWLYAGNGTIVNGAEFLSTERSIAFASWIGGRGQFHYVEPFDINKEEFFVPRVMESFDIPKKGRDLKQRVFPPRGDKTLVASYLGIKLSKHGSVAIFCGKKSSVIKICREIVQPLERIEQLQAPIEHSDHDEINKIGYLSELHLGGKSDVTKAIKLGVLPHSANIPNGLRISVEFAMENGLGRCVVCTSTLAQGVNLPLKYLVVSGLFQDKNKLISTRDFHNLLGRAGRAGKHTEGSIIFADTELFDQHRILKSKHWSQMNDLLDPSNSEGCLSSLLSLAQPLSGKDYYITPMDFLKQPDNYQKRCIELISEGEDYSGLLKQMKQRIGYLESLESFLLANLSTDEMLDGEALTELYSGTFAFSLASDEEKEYLAQVFRVVANRVKQVKPEKRSHYGKALLGIQELNYLEKWLSENLTVFGEESSVIDMLELLWPVIDNLAMNNSLGKLIGKDASLSIAKLWCSGVSYHEILLQSDMFGYKYKAGSKQWKLKTENITDICDNSLGYEVMLVVGASADLLENLFGNPLFTAVVRQLQLSLRIGVSDRLAIELFSLGLADRVVASTISEMLRSSGVVIKESGKKIITTHRQIIESELRKYPSVFIESLYGNI
ncbi:DEAD/DEAH box helicase domain protein [Shewanella baltica OS195]|uniref:DEAD/DEAH box helicase domain protein n=2 Tax=Shewanella baltica TaxID=62322 RepID=A9KZQ6_SHEB9|nr:DEAD/DEAH box helicase domain protein [Shewanella baltica OS195]